MNKLGQWVLSITAGIFFFFFFLFLLFPFDQVILHYLSKLEEEYSCRVHVSDIQFSVFFKSVFKEVKIYRKEDNKETLLLDFPEVKAGIHYLPLLAGKIKGSFLAKGKKGGMEGNFSVSRSKSEFQIDAQFDGINISDFPIVADRLEMELQGALYGDINMDYYGEQINKNKGQMNLKIKNMFFLEGTLTVQGNSISYPQMTLATLKEGIVKISLAGGKIDLQEISFPGEDVKLNLKGKIQLNKKILLSKISAEGFVNPSQEIKEALALEIFLGKETQEDGSYPLTISGRLSKPRIVSGTREIY